MIVVSMSNAGDTSGSNLVIMANGVGVATTAGGGGGEGAVNLAVTRLREDEKKTQVVSTALKTILNRKAIYRYLTGRLTLTCSR